MDKMCEYEVATMLENLPYLDVCNWERTRHMMYLYAQSLSKKQLKPEDILKFKWDRQGDTNISNEDIAHLKEMATKIEQQIKNE